MTDGHRYLAQLTLLFFCIYTPYLSADIDMEEQSTNSSEEPRPRWGLAAGTGWINDYPGAAQGRIRYLIMPAYRSKYLTIDRQDGAKAHLLMEDRFKFSVSFSFLLPTSSTDIPVRQGMPNLNLVLQLGPELQVFFLRTTHFKAFLRLPVRFIVATDFQYKFDYLQWTFAPSIRTEYDFGKPYGKLGTRLEFDYASQKYNGYFYSVAPQYATAGRPTYEAKQGIMEHIVGLNYSYEAFMPLTLSFGTNLYLMQNARNTDSPLLVRNRGQSFLFLAVYYF